MGEINNHPWETRESSVGAWNLKIGEMLGGVGEKMYFCIRLAAARHNIQASLSFCVRFAQFLHIQKDFKRLKGEDYGIRDKKHSCSYR